MNNLDKLLNRMERFRGRCYSQMRVYLDVEDLEVFYWEVFDQEVDYFEPE